MTELIPNVLEHIHTVLRSESKAIEDLIALTAEQESKIQSVIKQILAQCGNHGGNSANGRLILCGVGKAGIIAHKLSATFASTGTPSLFMHPTEARHGDLGMVQSDDIVLALSNSGSSEELISILPAIKRIGASIIAISGNQESALVQHADIALDIGKLTEACPLGLAPSTSTTAMLALGDALALCIQKLRQFKAEDYARYHPGGALGRKLMTCNEAMRDFQRVACVSPDTAINTALQAITKQRAGSAMIVDKEKHLLGIFTDGDLRRVLSESQDPGKTLQEPVKAHATMPCKSVTGTQLLQAALHICSEYKINELPVTDAGNKVIGMIDLQDLTDRGFAV